VVRLVRDKKLGEKMVWRGEQKDDYDTIWNKIKRN